MSEVWYRAVGNVTTSGYDVYSEEHYRLSNPRVSHSFLSYPVLRHTPKGVWVHTGGYPNPKRFVLRDARKRWACPTKEEALESLLARTRRRRKILSAQLRNASALVEHLVTLEGK